MSTFDDPVWDEMARIVGPRSERHQTLNPAEIAALDALADAVDAELDNDREWFQRHRRRNHRIRRAFPNEKRAFAVVNPWVEKVDLAVAVKQLKDGVRVRSPFVNQLGLELPTDDELRRLNERRAKHLFESVVADSQRDDLGAW